MYVCIYLCMYICKYVCMYVCSFVCIYVYKLKKFVFLFLSFTPNNVVIVLLRQVRELYSGSESPIVML